MPFFQANPEGNLAQFGNIQLHAPDIGSTLGAILRNRIAQQELQQQTGSDIAKMMQQQKQQVIANSLAQQKINQAWAAMGKSPEEQEMAKLQLDAMRQKLGWEPGAMNPYETDQAPTGKIYSATLGGYATPYQDYLAKRSMGAGQQVPAAQLQKKYGLTAEDFLNPDNAAFGDYTPRTGFIEGPGNYVSVKGAVMPSEDFKAWARKLGGQSQSPTADKNLAPGYGVPSNITQDQIDQAAQAAQAGPAVGTQRTINGQLAQWDGTGWVAVGQ